MVQDIARKLASKTHRRIKAKQKALLQRACEQIGCTPNWDVVLNRKVTPDLILR